MALIKPVVLAAIGSGRKIALGGIGCPALLIFHGRETVSASSVVNWAVRTKYPSADALLVASVIDMHTVPRLVRGIAEAAMAQAYFQAARQLPAGLTPEEHILILPDWDGSLTRSVGFRDTNRQAGLVVLDSQGSLVDVYQGEELVPNVWVLLKKLGMER